MLVEGVVRGYVDRCKGEVGGIHEGVRLGYASR